MNYSDYWVSCMHVNTLSSSHSPLIYLLNLTPTIITISLGSKFTEKSFPLNNMKLGAGCFRTCITQGSWWWVEVSCAGWCCTKWSLALGREETCRQEQTMGWIAIGLDLSLWWVVLCDRSNKSHGQRGLAQGGLPVCIEDRSGGLTCNTKLSVG